jgi:hypothetical protein
MVSNAPATRRRPGDGNVARLSVPDEPPGLPDEAGFGWSRAYRYADVLLCMIPPIQATRTLPDLEKLDKGLTSLPSPAASSSVIAQAPSRWCALSETVVTR